MRIEYNPRKFLLLVPLPMLREYFDGRGVLGEVAWDDLKEEDCEMVYAAWQALSAQARETIGDGMALANLCQTHSTLVKAQLKLSELGILYKAPSGYVMQSPLLGVVNQCIETITKLSREFRLTPAARSRIIAHTEEPDLDDELMQILTSPPPPRDFTQFGSKPQ